MHKPEVHYDAEGFTSRVKHPEDVTDALCRLTGITGEAERQACEDALYQLHATAENPYNFDYYRIFYAVLSQLTEISVPVRSGEWVISKKGNVSSIFACSECGREVEITNPYFGKPTTHAAAAYPYCHCGAKMADRQEVSGNG